MSFLLLVKQYIRVFPSNVEFTGADLLQTDHFFVVKYEPLFFPFCHRNVVPFIERPKMGQVRKKLILLCLRRAIIDEFLEPQVLCGETDVFLNFHQPVRLELEPFVMDQQVFWQFMDGDLFLGPGSLIALLTKVPIR